MQKKISQFCSHLVIVLSTPIYLTKKQTFYSIKFQSVSKAIKKLEKIDSDCRSSSKHSNTDSFQYVSINDFKPLNSIYSSVKLHEDDFLINKYQTNKKPNYQACKQQFNTCILEDWMIAKKAQTIPIEHYDHAQFSQKSILSYSQSAIHLIKSHSFQQFIKKTLKPTRSFPFFKDKTPTLKHKPDTLTQPLTNLPDQKIQLAIDLFQLLLKIAGQLYDPLPTIFTLWKFIKKIFQQIDTIKQQIFLQIIKQWSSKKKIYIQILACMSAIIQPPTRMYLPLLNFILNQSQDLNLSQYKPYFNFIFFSLIKNFSHPCKAAPSIPQLYCLMNLKKIPVMINFPRQNIFFIQFYSTVQQLLNQLISLYGLSKNTQYLLSVQNTLMLTGSILDGYNISKKDFDQETIWQKFITHRGYRVSIVIKNMMEMYNNQANFLLMFNYFLNQYRRGLFFVTNKVIFEIGGLIIASEIEVEDKYQFNITKYLPKNRYNDGLLQSKIQKIQEILISQYFKFQGTKMEARKKIIEILSKNFGFRTHFFYCKVYLDDSQYQSAWVGLKAESLFVLKKGSCGIKLQVPYEDIRQWGQSSTQLCLKIDHIGDLHIESKTLDVMVSIFNTYLNYLKTKLDQH